MQLERVVGPYVVDGLDVDVGVWETLIVRAVVVTDVVDSREASDAEAVEVED